MCDTNFNNLIDLSLDDDIPCASTQHKTEYETQTSKTTTAQPLLMMSTTSSDRGSLDNNPFDSIQKLVNRQDDPFDIVEREVCLKAQQSLKQQADVKVANLLSLSYDNIVDYKSVSTPNITADCLQKAKPHELDLESPPVMINEHLPPDTESDSNPNSSAETTASAKLKTALEHRKRLLKLSISNSAFGSPVARKSSLEFEDVTGTPVTTMLSKAAEFGEHFLGIESPLKLVDDDILSEESSSMVDSEKLFEADLEMMKIPILNDLPSPAVDSFNNNSIMKSPELLVSNLPSLETTLPNLEAIKSKLKTKREEDNKTHQQEILSLINNLKSLITSGDMVDESKKQHATSLLESLSMALKPSFSEGNLKAEQEPQLVKRQGTFNLELEESEENQLQKRMQIMDMAASMTCSTATYDGEQVEDKQYLNLPEIDSLSPQPELQQTDDCHHNINENSQNQLQYDVSDILEQLSNIFVNNEGNGQNTNNPTFIVVMNTNAMNQKSKPLQKSVDVKERSGFVASYLENTVNDGSPDLTKVNSNPRRRSQSLSLHDKVKIVHLPLPTTPCPIKKQNSMDISDSPPVTATLSTDDKETTELKTPARMVRRNSYSSVTPYTAQLRGRHSSFGSCDKNSTTQLRKTQKLESHREDYQHEAVVRPVSKPANNLSAFKPDLKKKTKNTESIMKSSGPLKATIPMKKVGPILKTSPPTPDKSNRKSSSFHNTSLQSQLGKTNRITTTPFTNDGIRIGYPNACSTPAAFTSPMKRTAGAINKSRYSCSSATPNSKAATNSISAASGNLKRRTITEFKAKSPLRPRVSSVGMAAAAGAVTSSRTSSVNPRLSTSAGARISKTPVKLPVPSTSSAGVTGLRYSVGGSSLSTKNKENKKP